MKEIDVTEGLSVSVWKSLQKAIDSNNGDSVYIFIKFFRHILRDSIFHRKIQYFNQFIQFPRIIYGMISGKHRENPSYQKLVRAISEDLSLHLKEIIAFYIAAEGRRAHTYEEKEIVNKFYYEAFSSFNALFFAVSRNQDWKMLDTCLNRYDQLGDGAFNIEMKETFELGALIRAETKDQNNERVIELRANVEIAKKYESFKRRIRVALKYWLYQLYDDNLIKAEDLNPILSIIDAYAYQPSDEIEDLLFFRSEDLRSYMNWENWLSIELREGEMTTIPAASDWITKGFLIDRIKSNNSYFNPSKIDPTHLDLIPFLHHALLEDSKELSQSFDKWKPILRVINYEELDERTNHLLSSIAQVKRKIIGERERIIAAAPLSEAHVNAFKQIVGNAWKQQTRIRRIFNYFGNIEDITGQTSPLLKRIGQDIFFERAKIQFIDGVYHSHIYGIESMGGTVGRWEDDLFLELIEKADNAPFVGKTLLDTVSGCIDELRNRKVIPTMIYLDANYVYQDENLFRSDRYSRDYDIKLNPDDLPFFVLGAIDNIPMCTSYSSKIKNKVIVCDFNNAFLMYHKTNDEWYDRELSVIVKAISDDLALKKFRSTPEKWRVTDDNILISDEDAMTLVRTSIQIDIETIADFSIKDLSKLKVGYITEMLEDQ